MKKIKKNQYHLMYIKEITWSGKNLQSVAMSGKCLRNEIGDGMSGVNRQSDTLTLLLLCLSVCHAHESLHPLYIKRTHYFIFIINVWSAFLYLLDSNNIQKYDAMHKLFDSIQIWLQIHIHCVSNYRQHGSFPHDSYFLQIFLKILFSFSLFTLFRILLPFFICFKVTFYM